MLEGAVGQGWAVPIVQCNDDASLKEALGEEGDIPGQTIIAMRSTTQAKRKQIQAFVDGWTKATDFAFASSTQDISNYVFEYYKNAIEPASFLRQIDVFKQSIWSKTNLFTEADFARTVSVMKDGQMITAAESVPLKYADNADMSFVRQSRRL